MLRLIKAYLASPRKQHLRDGTPSRVLNFRELNALLCEVSHLGFQIVAHEIKFVGTLFSGVECGFCRWQGEYQPAMARIHGFESENVAEKGAVRLGVFTVDNHVSAGDHLPLPKKTLGTPIRLAVPWNLENSNKIK